MSASAAQAQAQQSAAAEAVGAAANVVGGTLTTAQSSAAAQAGAAAVTPGTQITPEGEAAAAAAGVAAVGGGSGEQGGGLDEFGVLNREQIGKLWIAAGGSEALKQLAVDIAMCESLGDTSRIYNTAYPSRPNYSPPVGSNSPEYSVGLWQVNVLAHPQYSAKDMQNGYLNAKAIISISDGGKNFDKTNVYCYAVARQEEGLPGPAPPPLTPVTATEPAAIATAFAQLMDVLGKKVPEGLDSITSNANALVRIFP